MRKRNYLRQASAPKIQKEKGRPRSMSRPNEVSGSPLLLSLLLAQQSLLLSRSQRIRILISLQRILTPLKRARHLLLVRVPAHHRLLA